MARWARSDTFALCALLVSLCTAGGSLYGWFTSANQRELAELEAERERAALKLELEAERRARLALLTEVVIRVREEYDLPVPLELENNLDRLSRELEAQLSPHADMQPN